MNIWIWIVFINYTYLSESSIEISFIENAEYVPSFDSFVELCRTAIIHNSNILKIL